jgi:uncharacterized membrane protein
MQVSFKKTVERTIHISDSCKKYNIEHPYFSFSHEEIPYDSTIFKQCLDTGIIIVVDIMEGFVGEMNFKKYLKKDKQMEEENKVINAINDKIVKERIFRGRRKMTKEQKEKAKEEREKKKLDEKKNQVITLDDKDIMSKL